MPVLEMVIGAIVEMGVDATWDSVKRHETMLKLLKHLKLEPNTPPQDFEGIYAYTLVEYGVFKPQPVLKFFQNKFIQDAYKKAFYENDLSILDKEAEGIITWNEETGKLGRIDYDPRQEFSAFTLIFNRLVSYSRTPAEARREHKLDFLLEEVRKMNEQRYAGDTKNEKKPTAKAAHETRTINSHNLEKQVRWLHLSDFHVGKDDYGHRRMFKHILDHVQEKVEQGLAPDMVFITGDIANQGKESEYKEFNEKFYLPLVDILPPKSVDNIFFVPGNHDVDQSQAQLASAVLHGILDIDPKFLDNVDHDDKLARKEIFPRFKAFAANDILPEPEHWLFSHRGMFTKSIRVRNLQIGLVGVNTAWLSRDEKDRHQLSVGPITLQEALEKVEDNDCKLVLGHHPLDWLLDSDLEPMRTALGKHQAIYLHGHLHKGRSYYEEGAGYPFLTLQSGASFQSRADEAWVNRILWAQLDLTQQEIWLEPLQWSASQLEWKADTEAFPNHYQHGDYWMIPLPQPAEKTSRNPDTDKVLVKNLPGGWYIVDEDFLSSRKNKTDDDQILSFFDGREPFWNEALSPAIPRRDIVHKLVSDLNRIQDSKRNSVTLITGAAGEGKTTIFLQTIVDLVENKQNSWNVIAHFNTLTDLPDSFIFSLPRLDGGWLIVSDDAEIIGQDIFGIVQKLHEQRRNDIHFLLCARDTDWIAESINFPHEWRRYAEYREITIRGLSETDAAKVVEAWSLHKDKEKGLRELYNLSTPEAVARLLRAAEGENDKDTFFGAILDVRWGDELLERIEELLYSLQERQILDTKFTLLDALSYIAIPHAEDILTLPKVALAKILNLSMDELLKYVLRPLGQEAVIATSGHFVYTRHKTIAKALVKMLSEKLYMEPDELLADIQKTIISSFVNRKALQVKAQNSSQPKPSNIWLEYIDEWNYLSATLFKQGKKDLAIRLGKAALEADPTDSFFVSNLAYLQRKRGYPAMGAELFHAFPKEHGRHLGFFSEWGKCETDRGNQNLGAYLSGYSVTDQGDNEYIGTRLNQIKNQKRDELDRKRIVTSLHVMGGAFIDLFRNYNQQKFLGAGAVAIEFGLLLSLDDEKDDEQKSLFLAAQKKIIDLGFKEDIKKIPLMDTLVAGIIEAAQHSEMTLSELVSIPDASTFTFNKLERILHLS